MPTPELTNYIAQAKAAGMTEQQIKDELLKTGWQQADINEAFGGATGTTANLPSSAKKSSLKIGILAMIAILLIAGSAGAIWYADKNFGWGIVSPKKVADNITPSQESSLQTLPQESNSVNQIPNPTPSNQVVATVTKLTPKEKFLAMRKEFFRIMDLNAEKMKETHDFSPIYQSIEFKQLYNQYMPAEKIKEFESFPDVAKNLSLGFMLTSLPESSIEEKSINIQEQITNNTAMLNYITTRTSSPSTECTTKMVLENQEWMFQESNCEKKL